MTVPMKSKVFTKSPDAKTTAEKLIYRLYDDILQGHCVVFVGAGSMWQMVEERPFMAALK